MTRPKGPMAAPALSFASSSARSAAHLARSRLSVRFSLCSVTSAPPTSPVHSEGARPHCVSGGPREGGAREHGARSTFKSRCKRAAATKKSNADIMLEAAWALCERSSTEGKWLQNLFGSDLKCARAIWDRPQIEAREIPKSILMVVAKYPATSGHTSVINYLCKELNNLGYKTAIGAFSFDSDPPFNIQKITLSKKKLLMTGISYLNYRGFYGFSNFNMNDVNQLNNGYKLPFISTLTCGVNNFLDDSESVVEGLLRAGSVASPAGAVAVVGTSQSYTHTAFNNIVNMGMFEGIFVHEAETAGLALVYGKMALIDTYPQNPNDNSYLFASWNNLMGDPLTHLWTRKPSVLDNSHLQVVSESSDYFDVIVNDEEGRPVSDAIVTLYKNDEYSMSSRTDYFGRASFNLDYQDLGNVIVTSRCQNCVPGETSFEISNSLPNMILPLDSVDVSDAEQGNSDGSINPGETVELSFALQNISNENLEDCYVEVNSNYSSLQIQNSSFQFDSLSSNSSVQVEDISIYIDNFPSENTNLFNVFANVNCSDISWSFMIPFEVNYGSADIELVLISDQDNNMILDPGETGQFKLIINNNGFIDLQNLDVIIDYDGDIVDIENGQLNIDTLPLSDQNEDSMITIIASNNAVNGSIVNIPINVSSGNGYVEQLNSDIQIGLVSSADPLGPDEYGYYIYDESDSNYQWAPTYEWIEIDPDFGGLGTELPISDGGNNLDDSRIFNIPFTFTFYGEDYNQITICSNGWVAMGATEMTSFRNYNLPGPGGPSPMIAVFWDDLKTTNGGEILWYYDSIEDYLVIQWSEVRTYTDNDVETFQVILYNSGESTPTGDDEIKIQFKEFNNTSEGSYPVGNYDGPVVHGQYCSVGIENWYGTIGLEYTFNDQYPPSSNVLEDESALFITTRLPAIFSQPSLDISQNSFDLSVQPDSEESFSFSISGNGALIVLQEKNKGTKNTKNLA